MQDNFTISLVVFIKQNLKDCLTKPPIFLLNGEVICQPSDFSTYLKIIVNTMSMILLNFQESVDITDDLCIMGNVRVNMVDVIKLFLEEI